MKKYGRFTDQEIVLNNMVEVELVGGAEDGFRKVKETLQRMGVASRNTQTLYQTAHILHKRGKYYICHFLELFALDGREAELNEGDEARRNLIIKYLKDWGMIAPKSDEWEALVGPPRILKVLKYSEKDDWKLQAKYAIGNK